MAHLSGAVHQAVGGVHVELRKVSCAGNEDLTTSWQLGW